MKVLLRVFQTQLIGWVGFLVLSVDVRTLRWGVQLFLLTALGLGVCEV